MKQKYYWVFGIASLLGIILISGCAPQNKISETGFLEGKVTIGPICPVERTPPDPTCQPTEEVYNAWPIAIFSSDKKTKIAQIKPNLDGTYKAELPAGSYIVNVEKQRMFGKNLPAAVAIKPGETTTFDINIDTGIR